MSKKGDPKDKNLDSSDLIVGNTFVSAKMNDMGGGGGEERRGEVEGERRRKGRRRRGGKGVVEVQGDEDKKEKEVIHNVYECTWFCI